MNDYLTAVATLEMVRPHPRSSWTHRPQPRRRQRSIGSRIAALMRVAPPRRAAAVPC
jgi:hypothetical protein